MNASLHRFVRRWWTGRAGLTGIVLHALTAPAELVYRAEIARRARRWKSDRATRVPGLRVVSVGNLTVGGTGKTPLAAWIARLASDLGMHPALLARGYGRDELLLHEQWNPGVPVLAGTDRVQSARSALSSGIDVAILDDGFQYRRLARDVDLVLLAAEDPFPGRLLPRGPYREPVGALARAHVLIVTRRIASPEAARELVAAAQRAFPHLATASTYLALADWRTLRGEGASAPEGPILAVAGIARPEDFASQLSGALEGTVELASFPDHHEYTARDIEVLGHRANGRTLVTTEKDAVKLQAFVDRLPGARVVAQELRWESGHAAVVRLLTDLLNEET